MVLSIRTPCTNLVSSQSYDERRGHDSTRPEERALSEILRVAGEAVRRATAQDSAQGAEALLYLHLAGLLVRRAPERVPGRLPSSLLRFAERQDELIGVSANRLVEHFGRAGVCRIGENRTLGVELEPRGFDLSAHGRGLDAMQGLGYICRSTQSCGVIENYIYATGLQRTVDGLVKRGDVDGAHELVV